jgi:hypothetical protein
MQRNHEVFNRIYVRSDRKVLDHSTIAHDHHDREGHDFSRAASDATRRGFSR